MRTYTFDELVERYDLSKAGFSKFFHSNEEKLIKDGQKHYRFEGKRVFFDDVAVEIMDQLRGLNKDIISAKEETANEIRIRELLEENNNIKTKLLLLQEEAKADKERIIRLTEETVQVKLLAERNKNIAEQLDAAKLSAAQQAEKNEAVAAELASAKTELSTKTAEAAAARDELSNVEAQKADLIRQCHALQQQTQALQQQAQANYNAAANYKAELEKEQKKSFWERIKSFF